MINQWWNILGVPNVTTSLVKHSIDTVESATEYFVDVIRTQ
jgi:hypothetical protein